MTTNDTQPTTDFVTGCWSTDNSNPGLEEKMRYDLGQYVVLSDTNELVQVVFIVDINRIVVQLKDGSQDVVNVRIVKPCE